MTEPEQTTDKGNNRALAIITLLVLVFVILKLTHVTDWSWWAVTAPLWVPLAIGFVLSLAKSL